MPSLIKVEQRVKRLEERADATDERVDDLEAWLTDEAKLREIAEKRIELLEQAEAIRQRMAKRPR